jgi:hypothetical protein
MKPVILLFALLSLTYSFVGTQMSYTGVPSITPNTPSIVSQSSYTMATFLPVNITTMSYFELNFTDSQIKATDGLLNCSLVYLGITTTISSIKNNNLDCSCTNNVCIITPGVNLLSNNNVQIIFGNLMNPTYISNQVIYITVQINATRYSFKMATTISSQLYSALSLIINNVTQSDYSVGAVNVSYTFNFSLPYIPSNPQIQLLLPP